MSAELLNPPTPTFHHLGPPKWWRCPHCCLHVLVFPALPLNHVCANHNPNVSRRTFYCYYELAEDNRIRSLNTIGAVGSDPLFRVESVIDGAIVPWERREIEGELRFFPPDPERAADANLRYDDRIQVHALAPREELEYRALRCRHSA